MYTDFMLYTPTKLLFGCGKLNELGNQALPGKKALLLISSGKSVRVSDTLARNARETMGGLFLANPCEMTHEDCVGIFERAYR